MKKNIYKKTKTILTLFLFIGTIFLGSCITTNSIENINPIDLGMIDYRDYRYITIHSDHETNLSYVSSSPGVNQTGMQVEKTFFYPDLNDTKYRFEAREIKPDPYFISENKSYIYQDVNSGKLYSVTVDYSDVIVPKSSLQLDYEELMGNYTDLTMDYLNLTDLYQTLGNLTESLNSSLNMKIEEYQELYSEYNITDDKLVDVKKDFQDLTKRYSNLMTNYTMLNTTYNETYHNMMEYSTNLSAYKTFMDKLDGYSDGFYWDGQYYYTPFYYETKIEKLEDENGMIPIYIVLSIVLTLSIAVLLYRYIYSKRIETSMEIESKYGYDPETHNINRFSLNNIGQNLKNMVTKNPKTDNGGTKNNIPISNDGDGIKDIRNELDNHIDQKIQPIQKDISIMHKNIDEILSKLN